MLIPLVENSSKIRCSIVTLVTDDSFMTSPLPPALMTAKLLVSALRMVIPDKPDSVNRLYCPGASKIRSPDEALFSALDSSALFET